MSTIEKRSIRVLSDLPQVVLDLTMDEIWKLAVADLLVSLGELDAARIDIFRSSGDRFSVEVLPPANLLHAYIPKSRELNICSLCTAVYLKQGEHPENGCNIGVVDRVLHV